MKRLVCVVAFAALALPCAASDPGRAAGKNRPAGRGPSPHHLEGPVPTIVPAPKLVDDGLVQTVLLPHRVLGRWALARAGFPRGGRQATGNVIGLQVGTRSAP